MLCRIFKDYCVGVTNVMCTFVVQTRFLQELTSRGSNLMQIPGAEARQVTCPKLHSHREGRHCLILLFFFLLVPFSQIREPQLKQRSHSIISEVKRD